MHTDEACRWISDDGAWIWEPTTDRWQRRAPSRPPPSEDGPAPALSEASISPLLPGDPGLADDGDNSTPGERPSVAHFVADRATNRPTTAVEGAKPAARSQAPPSEPAVPPLPSEAELPDGAGERPPVGQLILDHPATERPTTEPAGAEPAARRASAAFDHRPPWPRPRVIAIATGAVVLVVLMAVLLSRCGGTSRAIQPGRSATTTAPTTPTSYPSAARQAYVDSCVGTTPQRRAFCDCTLSQLERTMTWAEFRSVGQAATAGDPAARQRYAVAVAACVQQASPLGRGE